MIYRVDIVNLVDSEQRKLLKAFANLGNCLSLIRSPVSGPNFKKLEVHRNDARWEILLKFLAVFLPLLNKTESHSRSFPVKSNPMLT